MRNFKSNVPMKQQNKKAPQSANAVALKKAKKNIVWQAGLALVTIVLTIVLVFAMTSAWYTNIVQTSGLTFEAEAWGFDGTITVNEAPIVAGPGDDGVIGLEVASNSETITAVGIQVSKARMSPEMQNRLYFYVDTQQTRNDETMSRVYLNNQDSYIYTLFGLGNLTLTETVHNDAQLKWHWVYDVLGYYVYGVETEDGSVQISEYLRPIEYDYDQATTMLIDDETGLPMMEIKTVDGVTTPEEFLVALSETDGYPGTIDVTQKLESGYYPVEVKTEGESRYGVYAYLCTYAEIELATRIDTALGKAAAEGTALQQRVDLTISAQKNKNSTINVTSLAGLNEAIAEGQADVIQLSNNITVPEDASLTIQKDQKIMLDLNGNTVVCEHPTAAIRVDEGGSLTMMNGSVEAAPQVNAKNGVWAVGAEVVMSNVIFNGFDYGVRIADDEGEAARDSRIHLINCALDGSTAAVFVKGNGTESLQETQLVVEGCTLTSDSYCISGSGNAPADGTDIQIINSTLIGNPDAYSAGIYHPQRDGRLTIYNSQITAYTAVAIKGGTVDIYGGTITGTGAAQEPTAQKSGYSDTGDGIYIEANYGHDIVLTIDGDSVIKSENGKSLQVFEPDAPNVTVRIISGVFDQVQPEAYIDAGSEQKDKTVKVKKQS